MSVSLKKPYTTRAADTDDLLAAVNAIAEISKTISYTGQYETSAEIDDNLLVIRAMLNKLLWNGN